ncbi:XdhC family protein [Actinomadura sp. 9N407]|uniref:XdhC family protein n=1 Tax=Actinomadura sp. 9N407 TaxID=3375154 RepID=UPI0037AE1123
MNDLAERLRSQRTPYVLATVVRTEKPTSARTGDRALVLPDGTLEGFVGGSCAASTVRTQALRLLDTGESTLLRITADPAISQALDGLVTVENPCLSGGTLDVFLEAVIPPALIQVYGDGPVARALVQVGGASGYETNLCTDPVPVVKDAAALVVATHGQNEEEVLSEALRFGIPYIGLIASRTRGKSVKSALEDGDRIHTPAGLDIGARTAPEIALSVVAEILSLRPRTRASTPTPIPIPDDPPPHEDSHDHCH